MIKHIKHAMNLVKHNFRDIGHGVKRSPHWRTVEKHFLESHGTCAACGGKEKLNVHHISPFHLFPERELDPNNLITLCMGKLECHFHLGHGKNFKMYVPNVRGLAAKALKYPEKFIDIVKEAFDSRKK